MQDLGLGDSIRKVVSRVKLHLLVVLLAESRLYPFHLGILATRLNRLQIERHLSLFALVIAARRELTRFHATSIAEPD